MTPKKAQRINATAHLRYQIASMREMAASYAAEMREHIELGNEPEADFAQEKMRHAQRMASKLRRDLIRALQDELKRANQPSNRHDSSVYDERGNLIGYAREKWADDGSYWVNPVTIDGVTLGGRFDSIEEVTEFFRFDY